MGMTVHRDEGSQQTRVRAHLFNAAGFARAVLGWTPDAKQAQVLSAGSRRVILNCSRQWGKSTVAAAKLVHVACMRPGSLSVIVSENMSQTAEVFQKIDRFFGEVGVAVKGERGQKFARVLPNRSRVIGLAAREEAVRGYTADFVFLDEAARVPDEVIDALLPVIALRNGDWWMASTPMGRRGRFYEAWAHQSGPDVLKVSAPWTENARMAPGFVERMREERGDAFVQQEFECQFVESGTYLLDQDHVDPIFVP
jgi:hypothetical protein